MRFVYNGDCSKIIEATSQFVAPDGTQYGADWDKSTIAGMVAVAESAPLNEDTHEFVSTEIIMLGGVPTVKRVGRKLADTEIAARRAAERANVCKNAIRDIESRITQRRLREAILGLDNGWLMSKNAEIAALRAQLV